MVSIIVPVYNEEPWKLSQAVMSILAQTYKGDIEIIVVDDGSDAGKNFDYNNIIYKIREMVIDNKGDSLLGEHNRYIKIYTQKHGGTASALNYGIKKSSGDLIGWLSSDDLFFLDKIQIQNEIMKQSEAMWSFTGFVNEENNLLNYYSGRGFFGKFCNFDKNQSMAQVIVDHFPNPCFINGCSVMYKREILNQVGYFNEELQITQDYDMWLRMAYISEPYVIVQPLVIHRASTREYADRDTIKSRELEIIKTNLARYKIGNFEKNLEQS
jgi:glycosyltransferase involved in cell wall biosynthesis